jgi:ABC-type multidrug transport system fused ATPase/permease subunit
MLSAEERRSAAALFVWMLMAMLLEMVSIGLVVPALAMMVGDSSRSSLRGISQWIPEFGRESANGWILIGLGVLLGVYVVKTAVLAFTTWQQQRLVAAMQADVSKRLYETYLRQPWTFHLQRNSSTLICNVENVYAVTDTVGWLLCMAAESLALAGIFAVLLWFEPLGAVAICGVALAATFALDRLTRKRLARWGELQQRHAIVRAKHMHEGLHGVKETLIRGSRGVRDQFAEANDAFTRITARKSFATHLPRLWYELVAVGALGVLAVVMAAEGRSSREMVPLLGLFAAAAFRVLPSVNRLAAAIQMLRYNEAIIDKIKDELLLAPQLPKSASPADDFRFEREISLQGVSYQYPGGENNAIHEVTLRIPAGSSVGLVGSSAAGKSTLVDVILGLLPPSAGRVLVDGIDIATNPGGWQRLVGYVPQSIYLTDDTVRRNVAFGVPDAEIDPQAIDRALRAAQLHEYAAGLPQGLDTIVGERGVRLSGGQRQRIGIARALYHDPDVLLLDEATSALDNATEAEVMAAVNRLQGAKTLVIVAHRTSTVAKCDMVYRIESGRVIESIKQSEPVSV